MKQRRSWRPADIKAEIEERGQTLSGLALANGLNESACRASLRRRQSQRADSVIAEFLGVALHELWPDRYDSSGQRHLTFKPRDSKHERAESHRLNDEAA